MNQPLLWRGESLCLAVERQRLLFFEKEGGEISLAFTKKQKIEMLAQYEQWLRESKAAFMLEYSRLTVAEVSALRAKVREVGGQAHVVKNTLLELALDRAGFEHKTLEGTTLIGFTGEDVAALAKVFHEVTRTSETLKLKGGFLDQRYISPDEVKMLAELPPLPMMRAQLLGVISAPATKLVRTLAEPARMIAAVIKAKSEQTAPVAAG